MTITDDRLKPAANNLTLVRLVLASAVMWTHAYWRLTGNSGTDDLSWLLGAPISAFAVDGFFFLSGFLVYASLLRRGSVIDFARGRLLRLWPALAASVTLTVAVGMTFTHLPVASYLQGETARFLTGNLTLTTGYYRLSGVMCGDGLCNVNGSLWTIPWEVRCYVLLAALALTGLSSRTAMLRLVLPLSLAGTVLFRIPGVPDLIAHWAGKGLVYNLGMIDRLWSMFALGIAAYLLRERIRLSWTLCAVLFALTIVQNQLLLNLHLDSIFVGYGVLCAGFLSARRTAIAGTWPDYSYGMYIYAFPVMMLISGLWSFEHRAALAAANALATLPLAALSWHLLEKPALDWGRRLSRKRRAAAEAG